MEIRYLESEIPLKETNLVLCIGFFDGMHIAHQKLVEEAISIGKASRLATGMMTFSTQVPAFIKNEQFYFLTSLETKIHLAEEAGFDYFYVFRVDDPLVNMDPEIFISRFLSHAHAIVVGFDFSFGRFGKGNPALLSSHAEFQTVVIPEMTDQDEKIGSTRIRQLLKAGNLPLANHLLGKPYVIEGKVIAGKGRGKILGFATANLDFDGYFIPKSGVYATLIDIDGQKWRSMTNIGTNPTFSGKTLSVESHIFGFGTDIYGKSVRLEFLCFLREDRKFPTTADLIEQMRKDADNVQTYFETGCHK